jgi:Uma2 family endonuclease
MTLTIPQPMSLEEYLAYGDNTVLVLVLTGSAYQEMTFTGPQLIKSPAFPSLALTAAQVLTAGR